MLHWTPDQLDAAADALRRGRLVGMPTETVYGLAGNALDPSAVARIFSAKGRPTFDPLIVHAPDPDAAFALALSVPELARRLAERFWPGPLTLVLPRRPDLPELLSAGLPTLALRVPAHPVARALLRACGLPLAAPSANRFGRISPTTALHVIEELDGQADVAGVLDAGPCALGVESTVVGFPAPGKAVVLRLGGLAVEDIAAVIGPLDIVRAQDAVDDPDVARRGEQSPGMLARHYAPRTPLVLLDEDAPPPPPEPGVGWLRFREDLSPQGDLVEAAANLFACLRRLDGAGLQKIIAWRVPDHGLGRAINDRLARAAHED